MESPYSTSLWLIVTSYISPSVSIFLPLTSYASWLSFNYYVSSPPDRPKSIHESFRMYTPLIPQAVDVPFCLCVEDEQDKLLVQWSGLEPLSKAFQLNIPFLMSTSSARLSYHCIWLGRRDLNSLWRSQSPMCCQLHYVPILFISFYFFLSQRSHRKAVKRKPISIPTSIPKKKNNHTNSFISFPRFLYIL